MKTVLVCGGRDYNNWAEFRDTLDDIFYSRGWTTELDDLGNCLPAVTIISGGARGADELAATYAMVNWTGYREYKADWTNHNKAAGPIRNQQMLDEEPDITLVIAFPGGSGTADMVRRAKKKGIEVKEVKHA